MTSHIEHIPGGRPLNFSYEAEEDVMIIEGIKYSGDFFRFMAISGPSDQAFRIKERNEDGVLVLEKVPLAPTQEGGIS